MLARLQDFALAKDLPWKETQVITSLFPTQDSITDINDDLTREMAFYEQALYAANQGREKLLESRFPSGFTRHLPFTLHLLGTESCHIIGRFSSIRFVEFLGPSKPKLLILALSFRVDLCK